MAPASMFSAPTSAASFDDLQFGLLKDAKIHGLDQWLASMSLQKHLQAAILWCHEEGAVSMKEVSENWQDLAEALNLKPLEKKRMEREGNAALQRMTHNVKTEGLTLGPTMATVPENMGYADHSPSPCHSAVSPGPYTDIQPEGHHHHYEPDTDIEALESHDDPDSEVWGSEPFFDIEPEECNEEHHWYDDENYDEYYAD